MSEYNPHTEDETQHPQPGDEPAAGVRWPGERSAEATPGEEPIEGHIEPSDDDEPMVEHIDERPLDDEDDEHDDAVDEPRWSEGAADENASPFVDEGVLDDETVADEEPTGADEGPIVLGARDTHDHTDETDEPAAEPEPASDTHDDTDETEETAAAADTASDTPPTTGDGFSVEHLIGPADAERFNGEWHDVKASFVDDPSDALQRASALSSQVLDELTASLGRLRQDLDDRWNDGDGPDTERLRIALRGYGSLIDRILST